MQQDVCTKASAGYPALLPGNLRRLHQDVCTRTSTPGRLHQAVYTKRFAPGRLHRGVCRLPFVKLPNFCDGADICSISSMMLASARFLRGDRLMPNLHQGIDPCTTSGHLFFPRSRPLCKVHLHVVAINVECAHECVCVCVCILMVCVCVCVYACVCLALRCITPMYCTFLPGGYVLRTQKSKYDTLNTSGMYRFT